MTRSDDANAAVSEPFPRKSQALRIERRGRFWAVYDNEALVCMTVYLKGAKEVLRRLQRTK